MLPRRLSTASVLLTSCLFLLAGCSEGGASATGTAAGGLEASEVEALAKTSKNARDFGKAIKSKILEKEGVIVPAKTVGKATKNGR